jgi:hypothetical protein
LSVNKLFYCPKCKRVYFIPSNASYLCNEERNFGLSPHEPWSIPEFVDYDASARTLSCLLGACGSPTQHPPSRGHNYELVTRHEVIQEFKEAVPLEVT